MVSFEWIVLNFGYGRSSLKDPYASKHKAVPVQKVEANIKINKISSETFKRTQFLLTLAWACTIHKLQSLILHKTVAPLELLKQRTFSPGLIHVTLSRSTSLPN